MSFSLEQQRAIALATAKAKAAAKKKSQPEEEKTLAGFGENVLSSGGQYWDEVKNMVLNPIDTLGNAADLAQGVAQKALPDDFTVFGMNPDAGMKNLFGDEEALAEQAGQFYKDRYGGAQNIADTAYEDPVGLLSDIAMVFGGGLKAAGSVANKVGGAGSTAAKVLNKSGKVVDGLDLLNSGVGLTTKTAAGLRGIPSGGAAKYAVDNTLQNAKFSTTLPEAQRARMAETLLQNNLDPTNAKSVQAMDSLLDKAEQASKKAIEQFDADGGMIDAMPAVDKMRGVLQSEQRMRGPMFAQRRNTVQGLIDDAMTDLQPTQGMMSGRDALDTRRAVDATVDWKQKGAAETASNQSMKAYANGLREQLAESVKGLDGVNKDYSRLVEAADPLRRATARNTNNDGGLRKMITGGLGAATAYSTGSLVPLVFSIIGNQSLKPATRQRLAKFMYDRSKNGSRSISDRALATEVMRVIQEIEQSTGQDNEQ